MRDQSISRFNDDGDEIEKDYSPNELAHLSNSNPEKYRQVVESNLDAGDSVKKWEERNRHNAQSHLRGY